jgi:hypothetical protein
MPEPDGPVRLSRPLVVRRRGLPLGDLGAHDRSCLVFAQAAPFGLPGAESRGGPREVRGCSRR